SDRQPAHLPPRPGEGGRAAAGWERPRATATARPFAPAAPTRLRLRLSRPPRGGEGEIWRRRNPFPPRRGEGGRAAAGWERPRATATARPFAPAAPTRL